MEKEEKFLTLREVSERTGAALNSVRFWIKSDEERAKRFPNAKKESSPIGDYWLIPESDLIGFELKGRGRPPKVDRRIK